MSEWQAGLSCLVRKRPRSCQARWTVLLALFVVALLACVWASTSIADPPQEAASRAHELGFSLTPSTTEPYAACPLPKPGFAECAAITVPPGAKQRVSPGYEGGGESKGWAPKELREAYNISETGGSGQTVAIVDAWDDPHLNSDLKVYREKYKLSVCTEENKCLKKVNQTGEEKNYPKPQGSEEEEAEDEWDIEISLDVDMVSAMCPECHILLVEANDAGLGNLYAAEKEAAEPALGVTEISNSWYGQESSEETSDDAYFNHPGIPITAAGGDYGYHRCFEGEGLCYPAASRYVISVGGTQLKKAEKTAEHPRGWEEIVWGSEGSTGGGCSLYESKPTWQTDWGCAKRMDNDVAAVASPRSPVSLYDGGWLLEGGTSAATPIIAGIEAHASKAVREERAEAFYRHKLFDVTLGDSGLCGDTYLCIAEEGYDGLTGWGTPDGPLELTAGFHAVTGEATNVTKTEATLNGYVDPEGLATTYHFEYGQTTAYGRSAPVPSESVGSGVVWKAVSESISVEQDATYHYRLVATNSSGTTYGQDHTFATIPWTIQETANPTGAKANLLGVSCTSSTACTAVGEYVNSSGTGVTLAELWNGTAWTIQSTPNPEGAKGSELRAVSCTSSTACATVGVYYTKTSIGTPEYQILTEHWNGTAWTIQSTPNPEGAKYIELRGVSCSSSTACSAVGDYTNSSGTEVTLAELWNGTAWTIQSTPNPEGAKQSVLRGVSCSSSTACTAVGEYVNSSSTYVALAERWNGTKWFLESLPNPVAADESDRYGNSELYGVSCSSSIQCVAVGQVDREDEITTLAEVWNGTEWYVQGAPRPSNSALQGVSCSTSTACTAVGGTLAEYGVLPSTSNPSVETKLATSITETGAALNGTVNPDGLATKYYFQYGPTTSYGSKTAEVPVGSERINLAESKAVTGLLPDTMYHFRIVATNVSGTTDGADQTLATLGTWSLQSTPNPTGATESYLAGAPYAGGTHISCSSSTACTGVGFYKNSSGTPNTLAERWNGTEWSIESTPNPSGAKESYLHGVSCSSSTACTVVGHYKNSSGTYVTLAERWNGTEWAIQSTPSPSEAKEAFLEDVSCSSSTICTAVGVYISSKDVPSTLAEQWNGTEWSIQSTPNPTGATQSEFRGMSCSSSTACTAVGWYKSSLGYAALVEHWNGTEWSIQSVAKPTGATFSWFGGVSCSSSSACTAVGDYTNSSNVTVTLAERWNGTEWSVQSIPSPSGSTENLLGGVSCPSSTVCTAVGYDENSSGTYVTLAERWSGTEWAILPTINPSGATESELSGVSCSSVTVCTTVGADKNSSGTPVTLAEIYG